MRYFGGIKRRRGGGINSWVGENEICEARRALRFGSDLTFGIPEKRLEVPLTCAYRRFYFDGYAVGKYEVGVATRYRAYIGLSKQETGRLINHFLKLPVRIWESPGKAKQVELGRAGDLLARLYSIATTAASYKAAWPEWSVGSGKPMLFLEQRPGEQVQQLAIPFQVRPVLLPNDWNGLQLSHCFVPYNGKEVPMWILSIKSGSNLESARTLRLYLMRLHAEQECLLHVLNNIADEHIQVSPDQKASEYLQRYLHDVTTRIGRLEAKSEQKYNLEVAEIARASVDRMSPGRTLQLLGRIEGLGIRPNVLRKIKYRVGILAGNVMVDNAEEIIVQNTKEVTVENAEKVDTGDDITISGSITNSIVNIKSRLDGTVQQINALPGADQATKDQLVQLTQQLSELLGQVPEKAPDKVADAETVSKRMETIVAEVGSPKPDKEVVNFSLESLKKAAANIAGVLPAVLPIAQQIASTVVKFLV
ncbi:MAG: hypothetical protein M3441_09130 [Chloroflexota bacterium]|nr:hypothetical protein [Chloroflexota bacterium]